ncbi:hypothetical protein DWU98_00185 [Dyella monticola]|uniref:Uncharacterized protein n=1 Tax=Dyella monticola TaxID=1927958 RepID=A0A370X7N1_9GAMM|nr:hypothetical protein DWU98_00185 [Dyella monticola]
MLSMLWLIWRRYRQSLPVRGPQMAPADMATRKLADRLKVAGACRGLNEYFPSSSKTRAVHRAFLIA